MCSIPCEISMLLKDFLIVIIQVQIYELEEHKIETWRGENISGVTSDFVFFW